MTLYCFVAQVVLAGIGEGISHEMITLEIQSSDVPDLTLIDLPGIARVATGNQPKDIEKQVRYRFAYARLEMFMVLSKFFNIINSNN